MCGEYREVLEDGEGGDYGAAIGILGALTLKGAPGKQRMHRRHHCDDVSGFFVLFVVSCLDDWLMAGGRLLVDCDVLLCGGRTDRMAAGQGRRNGGMHVVHVSFFLFSKNKSASIVYKLITTIMLMISKKYLLLLVYY